MSDVNAIINIDINSSSALVNLKRLESQIDQFNRSVSTSNATAAASQQGLNKALLDGINNTGLFTSKLVPVESSMIRFSRSIDEGRLSLGEYTRYASSQLPGLSRVFRKEFDTIEQVATSRVKSMQTQYVALGKTVDGVTKTIASAPTGLSKGLATDLAMVQQRQQVFNKLLDDGSTKLLNWGKNTQWAGRQLMVGFSLPLAAFGAVAAKTFMEIDKATISLKRVYGDLSTTREELNSNVEAVKGLGKEYTKYGITLAETISLSARAAATGATNEGLMAATEQTLRFATLGQMDYNQALDTTISLQTAFAISNEDLGKTVDYLNAVENQTILTMEDMSLAIPRVATVVKGLGGSVQDLAVMMTAMREGGVSAENAANGLKSGLASLINPTDRASESLTKMGVNLNAIITQNKGDLMGIITEFGTAINKLDEFSRQQVLEQVFGKYQYARMSALFTNITKDAGQAARAMDIAGMSAADLAKISEKELGQISESTSVKFQAAMEQLKMSIAPIGEAFLKGITPIVNMVSKIADAFNNLPDGVKNSIAVLTGVVAGLGPVFLMTIGLLGNGLANLVKGFQFFRKMIAGIKGDASAFTYLAQGELEAVTASKALENSSTILTDKLLLQRGAVSALTAEYQRFASAAGLAGASMGSMGGAAPRGAGGRRPLPSPRGFATGGIVPGTGNSDTIPALLTPGESVITKKATQKYAPILQQMNDGTLPGFAGGVTGLSRFLGRRTQFAHATGGRSVGGDEALRLLRPAERQLFQAPGSQSVNATALSGLTIGVSDLENQALRVGVGKGLNPKEFSQRILDEALTPDLFKRLSLPKETRTDFRKALSEEIKKIKKDPMFDDDLAKAFTSAEKRMVVKLKNKKALRDEFISSIASSRQDAFTRLKFNIPEDAPRVRNVAEARAEAGRTIGKDGRPLPTPTEPFYYYHAGQRKASALVRMPDGRIVGVQTDATRKVNPVQLSGGRVSIGQALKSWQTSSRSVREDPEMLGALMSAMRPAQSARTLTRGTTLGLSRGSEFDPSDERMIMDALRSGNVDSLIGRTFPMRGPISYTAGNSDSAINAMRQNSDVNRIEELKRQHAQAKQTHAARLKRIETLKKKIETGKGPISTYQAQLAELEGFVSMYAAGQKRRGKEIKSLTSRGYEDLLIEQSFPSGSSMIDVNEINPSGTFMGKDVSRENEFLSGGSIVRIKGVKIDPKTGLQTLELETISDNVQKRALGGPIVPGSGSGDTVPAMLTPGEFVINKKSTRENLPLLHAINNGNVKGYALGGKVRLPFAKKKDPKELFRDPYISEGSIERDKQGYVAGLTGFGEPIREDWNDVIIRLGKEAKLSGDTGWRERLIKEYDLPFDIKERLQREGGTYKRDSRDVAHERWFREEQKRQRERGPRPPSRQDLADKRWFEEQKARQSKIQGYSLGGKVRLPFAKKKDPKELFRDPYISEGSIERDKQGYVAGLTGFGEPIREDWNDVIIRLGKEAKLSGDTGWRERLIKEYDLPFDIKERLQREGGTYKEDPRVVADRRWFEKEKARQSKIQGYALGGTIPGVGNTDKVPAMLTPGEFVINKQATQSNLGLLHAINNGQTVKKNKGGMINGVQYLAEGDEVQSRRGGYSYRGRENISQHVATVIDPVYRAIKERELEAARRGAVAAEEVAKSLGATSGQLLNIVQIDRAHTVGGVDKSNPEDWTPDKWMPQIGAENQLSTILAQSNTNREVYLDHLKKIGATESEISSISHKVTSNIGLTSSELQVQSRVLQSMFSNSQDMARMSPSFELFARSTVASAQARAQVIPSPSQIVPGQRSFMEQGMISGGITEDSVLIQQERRQSESRRAIESSRKARLAKETRAVSSKGVAPQAAAIIALKNIRAKDQEDAIAINEELDALQEQVDSPEIDGLEDSGRRGSRGRRARFGRAAQMGGGAMMMASMALPMMANEQGKVMGMDAGALTGGLMGVGMLAEFAPLLMKLPPQIAIAGVAIAAATAGFVIWRKNVDDAAKKTAELGANMGGTSNALNNMATLLGTSTPAQRQAQMQLGFTAEQQQQAASQFQPMLESEAGQKFIKDLESATSADRFKKLSDYLKSAIASGMMDTQSANVFAKTIASALSDPVLGQSVIKSISGQKTGGAAMLDLAQNRASAVAAGGQLKVLDANQTVEETTASSVIGSSIQIIQDFSNAAALAKEELIAGGLSYSKYKNIIDQSTAAQEKYTQAIENSLIKTEDMGATMQAWKDQLILSGFSEDVVAKVEESTKFMGVGGAAQLARGNLGPANGENAKNFNKLLGQEKARKDLNITSEMLQAGATNALVSGMSPAQVVAITNEIKKGGTAAQTFSRTKDVGLAGLAMNVTNGAIPELAVSDELKARSQAVNDYRTKLPLSNEAGNAFRAGTLRAQQEVARREQGQQAYVSAGEKFKGAGFAVTDFQQVMSMVGSPNVVDLSFQLSGMSDTEIKDTVIQTQKLNELIGPEGSTKIMDILVNENPPDIDKRLPQITASIKDIMKIPDDVQKKLGIDATNVGDVDKWGPMADELTNLSTILDTMPEGVRSIGIDLMLDANGKPLSPEAYGKASRLVTKAYKDLASGNTQVKKKATITLIQETEGMMGKNLSLEESQQAYQDLIDTYGKGKITKLPPDSIVKVINLRVDIEGLDKAISNLDALIASGAAGNEERRAREKLAQLRGNALASEATAVQEGLGLAQGGTKDSSGGSGGSNPLLDLKKSILEQIKMYVDINATMKKLNDQKYKFANIIMGGQGVFDKLKSIKGIAGGFGANGLGSAAREAIMGMGPDAAKKWIEKNTTKNKKGQTVLTKKGQEEANQLEALSIKGTMTQNINAFESSRAQGRAAVNLKRKGVSDNVVQSIAGDPEKAKILDFLQQQINNKIKGSKKLYWEFVNAEKAAIEQAELFARAQDPIQTKIDDMTLAHRKTTSEIDKQVTIYQDQLDLINKEIEAIQELNDDDQNRIRNLDRQKEMINRDIEALSRKNELDQRSADALKREDEIRNRIADGLSHELDLMSEQETKIRDAYDKRVKALDEVAKINDYIINQQKSQLGLAQALSQGDVYAAAAAQQDMQAGTAQFAQQEMRSGLQTGMENQVAGLTTAGGLTRDQAEAQINTIKQQSYQTSLQIRDIEDAIYNRNLEMIPLKDRQLALDDQIRVIQDLIYGRETDIINIQDGKLAAAQSLLDKQVEIKAQLDKNFEQSVSDLELQNDLRKMSDAQANSVNALAMEYGQVANQLMRINKIAADKLQTLGGEPTKTVTETSADFEKRLKTWRDSVAAIETERDSASRAAVSNTPISGSSIPVAGSSGRGMLMATGGVVGAGARDSIPAMLTPGEFVMRKASVQKYGMPMLSKMNMGAFDMPRYNTQQPNATVVQPTSNTSNINAPVYNTYSVNVSANTNASADDIANTVMNKIKRVDSMAVRSFRGY